MKRLLALIALFFFVQDLRAADKSVEVVYEGIEEDQVEEDLFAEPIEQLFKNPALVTSETIILNKYWTLYKI